MSEIPETGYECLCMDLREGWRVSTIWGRMKNQGQITEGFVPQEQKCALYPEWVRNYK